MKLLLVLELTVEERYALEKRLGALLSKQAAEAWCEAALRKLIVAKSGIQEMEAAARSRKC